MEKTHINLVILSPSQEVNKLTFSGISTATSIGELRERISAEVATHPAPARQRLIYRGHPLIDVAKTLKDVFTQEIIDSSETLSLHLVLPPEMSTQLAPSASTAHPGQGQQALPAQHAHGSSSNSGTPQDPHQANENVHASQRPAAQGHIPTPSPPHYHVHAPGYGHSHGNGNGALQAQFPPQLQQAFAQFHAVNQQLAAQLAAIGNNPMLQGMPPNQPPAQPNQPPAFAQPAFQHAMAQQQQARAAGVQHGIHGGPMQNVQINPSTSSPQTVLSTPQSNDQGAASAPSTTPGNTSTVVRENHGPNGERWQMVIQSGPMNIHAHNGFPNPHAASPNSLHTGANTPRRTSPALQPSRSSQTAGIGATAGSPPPPAGIGRTPTPNVALMHLQSNLSTMDAAMVGGNPLPESVFEQAQEMIRGITDLPQEVATALRTRLANLSHHSSHLRENLHSNLIRAAHDRATSQRAAQGTESSAVYVLSSPSGPHALLVSPSGLYTAPWQFPSLGAITPQSVMLPTTTAPAQTQPANNNIPINEQHPHIDEVQVAQGQQQGPQPADVAQVAQAQQQQQVNQARDLARILLPLGGHLWLLIRLFGFVYFFTAGAGWRRTILLGLIASLVFIAQTGIFRPIIQGIWDPIRRHAEGLVPLAANERPRAGVGGAENNGNGTGTQPGNREPTPQEAAERLLQERERQDVSFVRQSFRRVERAVALFVASLVPGVGERHIAAREAAEAARQAEAREREERARKEEEEEARERLEGNIDVGDGNVADGAGEGGESSSAPEQQQAAQPPLVEV
ncbi:hypothetical protein HO173_003466 [Letharia columbiana]|uniref:Ubiquitin-like domain-containing protein n=1 Tax=Letharia columbiana TaxID=112416 RepID=A0A8H6G161_9LECA|nr:uncharacterized protein HO173_003466 [Letharia columbiana]KAF6238498.1 hypothetical protein HO173_003466 [Letharia columbiana]